MKAALIALAYACSIAFDAFLSFVAGAAVLAVYGSPQAGVVAAWAVLFLTMAVTFNGGWLKLLGTVFSSPFFWVAYLLTEITE